MLALTVHQPWAHLIAIGRKTIETRAWLTAHRGPLAIHASKRLADAALCRRFGLRPDDLARQAIVAVVDVTDARVLTALDSVAACCSARGRRGLILVNIRRLAQPVTVRGYQRFWHLPADIESLVLAQL